MSSTERVRRFRARQREQRYQAWALELEPAWHPFLEAWAARGLQRPPTAAQFRLLEHYATLARGPAQLGAILARVKRAGARHRPHTYGIVAAVLRTIEQLRQLAGDARDAFERPLSLEDPNGRRERGEGIEGAPNPRRRPKRLPAAGQRTIDGKPARGSLGDALRRHGLAPGLADELERK